MKVLVISVRYYCVYAAIRFSDIGLFLTCTCVMFCRDDVSLRFLFLYFLISVCLRLAFFSLMRTETVINVDVSLNFC